MSSLPPPPAALDDSLYRPFLEDLIGMGAAVMRGIHQKANARHAARAHGDKGDRDLADLVDGFERVSRGIRRSILLAMRSPNPAQTGAADARALRKRIVQQVEDAIGRIPERSDTSELFDEFADDCELLDPEDELPDLPTPDIIAEICRDLGLASLSVTTRAWKRHIAADVQALCARAAWLPRKD